MENLIILGAPPHNVEARIDQWQSYFSSLYFHKEYTHLQSCSAFSLRISVGICDQTSTDVFQCDHLE